MQREHHQQGDAADRKFVGIGFNIVEPDICVDRGAVVALREKRYDGYGYGNDRKDSDLGRDQIAADVFEKIARSLSDISRQQRRDVAISRPLT